MGDHAVALGSYDEPGHTFSHGRCSCGWAGPLRVAREQAVTDAARHLYDPGAAEHGPDWHGLVGEPRLRRYERFRDALAT